MTEFKKWREKGKILRSIIHATLLTNNKLKLKLKLKFNFKLNSFAADDRKVHNNINGTDHVCMKEIEGDKTTSSVFCKAGLIPSLVRVPSRGLKKISRVVSMRKHEEEGVGGGGSLELCKKRIIMGKKCRPLNVSGALRYDKNGVLVPEDLLVSPSNHLG